MTKTLDAAIKSPTIAKGAGLIANALVATSLQPSRYTDVLAQVKIEDPKLSEKQANVKAIKRLYIMNLSEMTGEFITKTKKRMKSCNLVRHNQSCKCNPSSNNALCFSGPI